MKKSILLLLIAVSVISCNKKHCWHCISTAKYTNNVPSTEHENGMVCDKTKAEIREYETQHTYTYPTTSTGVNMESLTMHCDKQ